MSSIGRVVVVAVAAALAVVTQSGASGEVTAEGPRLVVLLEPARAQFVLLEGESRPPGGEGRQIPPYNFLVLAVDQDHPPERALAFANAFLSPGETRKVSGGSGDVKVTGTAGISTAGVAKYEAVLGIAGKRSTSTSAFLHIGATE